MNTHDLLSQVTAPVYEVLLSLGAIGVVIWIVLKILAIAVPVILGVAFYVLWERKLIGWMHSRHGPMYVGFGVLQTFADVFKLLFKEVIQPTKAHKALYVLAPLITMAPAFAAVGSVASRPPATIAPAQPPTPDRMATYCLPSGPLYETGCPMIPEPHLNCQSSSPVRASRALKYPSIVP